jgi:bacteriocin biosynthesis cyclodehydratase domain-containing protein
MPNFSLRKPRLPSHYQVWADPPDDAGDEVLHFVSGRRSLKLKGHSFREFQRVAVPLLDGTRTLDEVLAAAAETFQPADLMTCLELLAEQRLLEEGDDGIDAVTRRRLEPQLGFFHEIDGDSGAMQDRLSKASVSILGLGGAGAAVARSLSAAGVGRIRCIDPLPVTEADSYLSGIYRTTDAGRNRAEVLTNYLQDCAPACNAEAWATAIDDDGQLKAALDPSDFIVSCLDQGRANLNYKLNRACLESRRPWTSCAISGAEISIGPTIVGPDDPCFMCYRMRLVACAGDPEDAFASERYWDRLKRDDSSRRENLVFGAGLAAHLVALEVFKFLTRAGQLATRGKVQVLNLLDLSQTRHVVLRKPWCPACYQLHQNPADSDN